MSAPLDCPGIECWQALFDDALPPEQQEHCERHLEVCTPCQERLRWAEEGGEALLKLVQEVAGSTVASADPTLAQFLERLHEIDYADRSAPVEPADLYFLRPADRPDLLGVLGAYQVQEVIGQGGMGVVLKAFDPTLNRLVAIKVMASAVVGSAMARKRFAREARAAAAVCHDHIVAVHGVHEADGLPYLVMQYIAGESLQSRLDRTGPLEVEEIVRIGMQTTSGLAAAHAQGLIHRDIKPANLLLWEAAAPDRTDRTYESHPSSPSYPFTIKITDFGLARMIDDVALTQNGVVAGTPEYMAPEQARGEPIDYRADLFSLGSVLYAMCTGAPPFQGASAVAVLRQVTDREPTPVRTLNPAVPAWLETLIAWLMEKDSADRFPSAAEAAIVLENGLAHLRQPETIPPPEMPIAFGQGNFPALREVARRFWLPGLLLLAAAGLALFLLAQAALPPEPRRAAKPAPAATVYQDFRGSRPLLPSMKLKGPDVEAVARPEDGGLRITLPATREVHQPVSIVPAVTLSGDFEITGAYELLSATRPSRGYGVGVSLSVASNDARDTFAKVARLMCVKEGSAYVTEYWHKVPPEDPWDFKWKPTEARAGKLRLVREGSVLRFLVAEGQENDFREIYQRKFTPEDLAHVHFAVTDSGSPGNAVDARLVELKIRSGRLIPEPGSDDVPPPEEGEKTASKGWLAPLLLGLAVGVAFAIGAAAWRIRRQGRRAEPPATDSLAVSFACSACGKNLKARAELAGKKVKCSGCARGVLVPPGPSSDAPRPGKRKG